MENNVFGTNLRKLRKAKGYTQQQLSELSGLTRTTIMQYEKGMFEPRLIPLQKICRALECDFVDFYPQMGKRLETYKDVLEIILHLVEETSLFSLNVIKNGDKEEVVISSDEYQIVQFVKKLSSMMSLKGDFSNQDYIDNINKLLSTFDISIFAQKK